MIIMPFSISNTTWCERLKNGLIYFPNESFIKFILLFDIHLISSTLSFYSQIHVHYENLPKACAIKLIPVSFSAGKPPWLSVHETLPEPEQWQVCFFESWSHLGKNGCIPWDQHTQELRLSSVPLPLLTNGSLVDKMIYFRFIFDSLYSLQKYSLSDGIDCLFRGFCRFYLQLILERDTIRMR